jgi:hypothetical protein
VKSPRASLINEISGSNKYRLLLDVCAFVGAATASGGGGGGVCAKAGATASAAARVVSHFMGLFPKLKNRVTAVWLPKEKGKT